MVTVPEIGYICGVVRFFFWKKRRGNVTLVGRLWTPVKKADWGLTGEFWRRYIVNIKYYIYYTYTYIADIIIAYIIFMLTNF